MFNDTPHEFRRNLQGREGTKLTLKLVGIYLITEVLVFLTCYHYHLSYWNMLFIVVILFCSNVALGIFVSWLNVLYYRKHEIKRSYTIEG